jgi:hypothetical protein
LLRTKITADGLLNVALRGHHGPCLETREKIDLIQDRQVQRIDHGHIEYALFKPDRHYRVLVNQPLRQEANDIR